MRGFLLWLVAMLLVAVSGPASASPTVLYNNGAAMECGGWTIGQYTPGVFCGDSWFVSNSFHLCSPSIVCGFTFASMVGKGEDLQAICYDIRSKCGAAPCCGAFCGPLTSSGKVALVGTCLGSPPSYPPNHACFDNVCNAATISPVVLPAGCYFLELHNACLTPDTPFCFAAHPACSFPTCNSYWNISKGPSAVFQMDDTGFHANRAPDSDVFTVDGTAVPEVNSQEWQTPVAALLGVLLVAFDRRRRRTV